METNKHQSGGTYRRKQSSERSGFNAYLRFLRYLLFKEIFVLPIRSRFTKGNEEHEEIYNLTTDYADQTDYCQSGSDLWWQASRLHLVTGHRSP